MDNHIFQHVLTFLQTHPNFGIWFAFLVAFLESLPIIGTIVPGSITMTVIGILIGSGGLPLLPTLIVASIAAFLGDCIGYAAGFYYNNRLRTMWPFKKHPKFLTIGESFFKKHGGKSIIIGRFFGPGRSTVPLIAGLLKLRALRFVMAAIPSAIMWAALYLVPGVVLGELSREIPKQETTRFILYGFITILVLFSIYWVIQHFFLQLSRLINRLTDAGWKKLAHKAWGRKIIHLIANRKTPEDHMPLLMLFYAVLTGILFLILFASVKHQGILTHINFPVFHLLQSVRTPKLDRIFTAITVFATPLNILTIALFLSAFLILYKQKRAGYHLIGTTALGVCAIKFFKLLSHSARPSGFVFVAPTSSFPSGHTTLSLVTLFFITYLFATYLKKAYRAALYVSVLMLIVLIGFSRIYLGCHWIDDIIGSLLCGCTILLLGCISYRRHPSTLNKRTISPLKILLMLSISLIIPTLFFIKKSYYETLINTQQITHQEIVATQDWLNNLVPSIPLYRNNRLGKPSQPLNVQWSAPLNTIQSILKEQGWETLPIRHELKSTLARFASEDAKYHMPLFTWLYHNQLPALIMIKHIPMEKRIIELHLWNSNIFLDNNQYPLWIGTVDVRIPPKLLLSLKDEAKISLANNGGLDDLMHDTGNCDHKVLEITKTKIPPNVLPLEWNRKIILIQCAP